MKIRIGKEASYLRVLNAIPNSDNIDIYANGNLIFSSIEYKNFSSYTPTSPGNYNIEVYRSGENNDSLHTHTLNIAGGNVGTLVVTGILPKLMLLAVYEDPHEEVENGNAKFRIAHLSPTSSPVDIVVNNVKMIDEIPFGKRTNYAEIPNGMYKFLVEENEFDRTDTDNYLQVRQNVEIKDKKIYTIYILGDAPNVEIIQSLDLTTYMNN
ncbi:MAG: DUF4397 domain-containing protein [Paraclostridium sp.]